MEQAVYVQIRGRGFTADEHLDCTHKTAAAKAADWVKRTLKKYNVMEGATITVRLGPCKGLEPTPPEPEPKPLEHEG